MLSNSEMPPLTRLHALCTLDRLEAVDADLLRQNMGIHPGVDRHIVRLTEPLLDHSPDLASAIVGLVETDDPQLLMQLAYSLGEWHSPDAGKALGRLAQRSIVAGAPVRTGTVYFHAAMLSSVNRENLPGLVEAVVQRTDELAGLEDFVREVAMLTVVMESDAALTPLARSISASDEGIATRRMAALEGLFDGLNRRRLGLKELMPSAPEAARASLSRVGGLITSARVVAGDANSPEGSRLRAVRLLGRFDDERPADIAALQELLSPQTPAALQSAAVAALAATGAEQVPKLLLSSWSGYGPDLRGQVVDALIGRDLWLRELLDEINAQHVPASAIDAARRQRMLEHHDEAIRREAQRIMAGAVNADRQEVIDRYREATKLAGSAERGAVVFKKSCSACHRLADVGYVVGPDLSALTDRSPQAMLTAIFDPNRAVEAKFLNYTAVTTGGVTYTGILASETGNSIGLLAADAKEIVILRTDLDALASSNKSLMPEGLEKDLSPRDMADLLAWLSGFRLPRKTFDGNEPKLVRPEGLRGELWLLAKDCEIYGKTLVFEPQYGNLGYWQSDDDHAAWSLEIVRPGKYTLSLDYACDNSAAGQTVVVDVAGQQVTTKVPGTGNWDSYRQLQLGQVELATGVQPLVVRPDGRLAGPLIDLKSVRLHPVK
jgi:putative heme-binding domain-containing protein